MMTRANWTNAETKKLLDLIYELKLKNIKPNWNSITKEFKAVTGIDRTISHIKTCLDGSKQNIKAYEKLINMIGVGVDPTTKVPIYSNKQWERLK